MYLDKVKDLEDITLGKNMVLVELVEEKMQSTLIIPDSGASIGPKSYLKEVVIKSEYEGILPGDVVLDARYAIGQGGPLKFGDKTYALTFGHDIKMWTNPENFDENKKPEVKESVIKTSNKTFTQEELNKLASESKGFDSKYINNK